MGNVESSPAAASDFLTYDELQVGMKFAPHQVALDEQRVQDMIAITGDHHPFFVAPAAVDSDQPRVAPPLLVGHYSHVKKTLPKLPPDGTLHISESFEFLHPVPVGATLSFHTHIAEKYLHKGFPHVVIASDVIDDDGRTVARLSGVYRWAS